VQKTRLTPTGQNPELAWTLPRALRRGQDYQWMVEATVDGKIRDSSPRLAKFRVLSAEDHARVRLSQGLQAIQSGLLDDAEREMQAALEASPI
jgi:hypothetical protein